MSRLTQEEKRIRLAKAEGWKPYPAENVGAAARLFNGDVWFRHAESSTIATPKEIPDYFGDLNACHALETALTEAQHNVFKRRLAVIAGYRDGKRGASPGWRNRYVSATAAQRAEALGFALGLWKEGE